MKQEEKELVETQSIPLRNYLMRHVLPTLTEGLVEVCKVKPDDPVDYLVSVRVLIIIYNQLINYYRNYCYRQNICSRIILKLIDNY